MARCLLILGSRNILESSNHLLGVPLSDSRKPSMRTLPVRPLETHFLRVAGNAIAR